jgi:hypothetical protein
MNVNKIFGVYGGDFSLLAQLAHQTRPILENANEIIEQSISKILSRF